MSNARKEIKNIIFADDPARVALGLRAENAKLFRDPATLIIAMTPAVYAYALKKGLNAKNTTDYFTNNSHIDGIKKSKIILEWIRNNTCFSGLEALGIKNSYADSFILWMRCAVSYCLWNIETVINAVIEHKPDKTYAFLQDVSPVHTVFIEPHENFLGQISESAASLFNIEFISVSGKRARGIKKFFRQKKDMAAAVAKFIARYFKFSIWKMLISCVKIDVKRDAVMYTSRKLVKIIERDMPHVSAYFLKGPVILPFEIPNFLLRILGGKYAGIILRQKAQLYDLAKKIAASGNVFSYRDISFAALLSGKMKRNIISFMIGELLWIIELGGIFDRIKPRAIFSTGDRFDDILIADLSNFKHIKAALVSHGSFVMPKDEHEEFAWGEHGRSFLRGPFSFHALQSPLAEGYFKTFPSKGGIIKTGPLIWGKPLNHDNAKMLYKKMFGARYDKKKQKIIIHAGTPKPGNIMKFHIYETPDEYIQDIVDVANAVKSMDDAILIVRFRPSAQISAADIRRLVPFSEKIILSINEKFSDILAMADLLVSFSSTTIEEALQNRIPVLLYGGGGRYCHVPPLYADENKTVNASAVYHVTNAKDLKDSIKFILECNSGRENTDELFSPYIYPEEKREKLRTILK